MHTTAIEKFKYFVFMGIAKLPVKNYLYSCAISWKNSDLNFVIMQNCVQKNLFVLNEWAAKLVSYWYKNDVEFYAKKSNFVQNHATVVQENWLFHGKTIYNTAVSVQLPCLADLSFFSGSHCETKSED